MNEETREKAIDLLIELAIANDWWRDELPTFYRLNEDTIKEIEENR